MSVIIARSTRRHHWKPVHRDFPKQGVTVRQHKRTSTLPSGICPSCKAEVTLRDSGLVRSHAAGGSTVAALKGRYACLGVGTEPIEEVN